MNANNIQADFNRKAAQLEAYARTGMPRMARDKTLRFIDNNFRGQGYYGRSLERWPANKRKGTILVNKGRLRRSFRSELGDGTIRIWTDTPYARTHNRGFNGTVNVSSFTRNKYTAGKVGTGRFTASGTERTRTVHTVSSTSQVKAHTRKMNTQKRQFMPESPADAPVLIGSIRREVIKTIKSIFS